MRAELPVVFVARSDAEGLELRINFGVFAGRDATAAELEELAAALGRDVGELTIVSERRYEIGTHVEATLHQVRIEIERDRLPGNPTELAEFRGRLVERATAWAEACIAERHAEVTEL